MSRSVRIRGRRTRRVRSSGARSYLVSALVLAALGGMILLLLNLDFGKAIKFEDAKKLEEGGRLVIGIPPQQASQPQAKPDPPDHSNKDIDTLTFYETLAGKADQNPSSMDFQPRKPRFDSAKSKKRARKPVNKEQDHHLKYEMAGDSSGGTLTEAYRAMKSPEMKTKRYTLQVGSFLEKETAEKLVKKLRVRGYSAYLIEAMLADQDLRYRVRVGSFSDKVHAKVLAEQLEKKEGLKSYIAFTGEGVH